MKALFSLLSLLLPLSQPPGDPPVVPPDLRRGEDIAAWRELTGSGLPLQALPSAYADFVGRYPRSALAEVALARCLGQDGLAESALARLAAADRNDLADRFRTHRETLSHRAPEGPAVSEVSD
ncbi:MAG: hypothetical protein JXB39_07365 [Deltaproteobacteria bacterium]|nr:hypothetical protein [Deltaproteobacteria bacterium]